MKRTDLYSCFARQFALDRMEPMGPCDDARINRIEDALETMLPCSYREFLTRCGPLFVPRLSDSIEHTELGINLVREFFTPEEVVRDTRLYWSGGMPSDFIGIASDGCGNMFGFRREQARTDDSPVLFFDHDFVSVKQDADAFDSWLARFLNEVPA
jgi:hypothetical protein